MQLHYTRSIYAVYISYIYIMLSACHPFRLLWSSEIQQKAAELFSPMCQLVFLRLGRAPVCFYAGFQHSVQLAVWLPDPALSE